MGGRTDRSHETGLLRTYTKLAEFYSLASAPTLSAHKHFTHEPLYPFQRRRTARLKSQIQELQASIDLGKEHQ